MKTFMGLLGGLLLGWLVVSSLFAQEIFIITDADGIKQTHLSILTLPVDAALFPSSIVEGDWTGDNDISFTVLNQTTIDTFSITFRNVGGCSKVTVKTTPVTISGGGFTISYNIPTISNGSLTGTFAADGQSCSGTFNYTNLQCGGSKSGAWSAQPVNMPPATWNPPSNLRASLSANIVTLNWDAPAAGAPLTTTLNSRLSMIKLHSTFKKSFARAPQKPFTAPALTALNFSEVEPNNDFSHAQIVSGPSPAVVDANAEISDQGTVVIQYDTGAEDDLEDLFAVTMQSAGLNLTLTGISSDLDIFLLKVTGDLIEIIDASLNIGVVDETIDQPALAAGAYYVGVSIYDPDPGGPNSSPYRLTVTGDFGGGVAGLQHYNIYRSATPDPKTSGALIGTAEASATTFHDDVSARSESRLYYQVTAVYDGGESEPSNEVYVDLGTQPNQSPDLTEIGEQTITAGTVKQLTLSATDADGDLLSFSIPENPGFLSITDQSQVGNTATANLLLSPSAQLSGLFNAAVAVNDGRGGSDREDFSIEVVEPQPAGTWIRQHPYMPLSDLKSVHFVNANIGWVVGDGAVIFKTTDGGVSWAQQNSGKPSWSFLQSVYFIDAQIGWAVGYPWDDIGPVIRTTDGGATWTPAVTKLEKNLYDVWFVNTQTGWAAGDNGAIFKTLDGGLTWNAQQSGTTERLNSIFFVDAETGWITGSQGVILKTTNGGTTWTPQTSGTHHNLLSVYFLNSQTGWISTHYDQILKTTDGGQSWQIISTHIYGYLNSICFADAQTGWVACDIMFAGKILKTTDGGITWSVQDMPEELTGIHFANAQTGWAVGDGGIVLKTTNGGVTWNNQSFVTLNRLWAAHFLDSNIGWLGGSNGTLLKTTDAGMTWQIVSTPNLLTIYDLYFADSQTGWACLGNGKIWKTTNGGNSWTQVATSTTNAFHGMFFADAKTGWAAGGGAVSRVLHKTTDGGNSWISQNLPPGTSLMNVFFIDKLTGWAVGMNGSILKTTDGGESWLSQNSGCTEWLESLYFKDASTGWVVGETSILQTNDGGATWSSLGEFSGWIEDVYFVDDLHGWAIGAISGVLSKSIDGSGTIDISGGTSKIWKTMDGGNTWSEEVWPVGSWLLSAVFTDLNSGWAVGSRGSILKYGNSLPIPRAPTNLTAITLSANEIQLSWTDNAMDEDGYQIYRSEGVSGAYKLLTTVAANATSYNDLSVTNQTPYWYRVCAFNSVGRSALSLDATATAGVVAVNSDPELPKVFVLRQNYPNPFNPTTTIEFSLPRACEATLKIYNIHGEEVATLVSEKLPAGNYQRVWSAGEVSSGVYFYRLQAGTFVQTRRLLFLK